MTITNGKDWRSEFDAAEVTLPSGKVALLKKPDVLEILADADMPDLVTNKMIEGMTGQKQTAEIKREDMPKMLGILNKMCKLCFVTPRVVDQAVADDEIELRHITFNDKVAVLEFAFGQEGIAAQTFRRQSDAGVAAVPSGYHLQQAAKRGIGDTN